MTMSNAVETTHPLYDQYLPLWQKINDIVRSQNLSNYLIRPMATGDKQWDEKNWLDYAERAVFYAFAGWTVTGMVGSMFTKWPSFNAPDAMHYLTTNCDGSGISIYQQSQEVASWICSISRGGLFVSFPKVEGKLSQADMESGKFNATIHAISAQDIINWGVTSDGAGVKLSLVVFKTVEHEVNDEYETNEVVVYRELRLIDGVFHDRKHRSVNGQITSEEGYAPIMNGNNLDFIPFRFVGATKNTQSVDEPAMKEIVAINIGHYRNSADYEDNVYWCGMVQPWMSGMTQQHIDLLSENNMIVGSKMMLAVPAGEQFGYASATPNPAVLEAMNKKVEMIVGLGGRFLQPGSATKTATQAEGDLEMQHSVLSLISSNISEAYTDAVRWACMYMGQPTDEVDYRLSQEFTRAQINPELLGKLSELVSAGHMPIAGLFDYLRKNAIVDPAKTDEELLDEIGSATNGMPNIGGEE